MANVLCNSTAIIRPQEKGSRTEIALIYFAEKCGYNYEKYREKYKVLHRVPFNSADKYMSTVIQLDGE